MPKRKAPLTCERIVLAAVALADAHGVEALTMRALAHKLGIEAMSLYSHVASKHEILSRVVAWLMRSVKLPPASLPPKRRLIAIARAVRDLGHQHPNLFPLVVLQSTRLDAALIPVEAILDAFVKLGLKGNRAVLAQRLLLGFTRGYTMWELGGFASGRRTGPGGGIRPAALAEMRALDSERFPSITTLLTSLVEFDPDTEFDQCLDLIIRSVTAATTSPARAASQRKTRRTAKRAPSPRRS
jgi:AcrR family transcriptional regulator